MKSSCRRFTSKDLVSRLILASLACNALTADAASFSITAFAGTGPNGEFQSRAVAGSLDSATIGHFLNVNLDFGLDGGYDRGFASFAGNSTSFDARTETISSPGRETSHASVEVEIFWTSAPLLISSSHIGRGVVIIDGGCDDNGQFTTCDYTGSHAGPGSGYMAVQFNLPMPVSFHLSAYSFGSDETTTSVVGAFFNGQVVEAFDENMNPVDFSYRYTPEPSAGLLLLSGIGTLVIVRRRRRHINVTERGHRMKQDAMTRSAWIENKELEIG